MENDKDKNITENSDLKEETIDNVNYNQVACGSGIKTNSKAELDDTEVVDEDEDVEEPVTWSDVINQQEEEEQNAMALLGHFDEKNCTYPKGYVKRQALYVCETCYETSKQLAAVCVGCILNCHENHKYFELYTKRNFRCDCGNDRFSTFSCKLNPSKTPVNDLNKYDKNFEGLYCYCIKPYDPDERSEMLQCIICEDWYHQEHFTSKMPDGDTFSEIICSRCTPRLDFLWAYTEYMVTCDEKDSIVDVEGINETDANKDLSAQQTNGPSESCNSITEEGIVNNNTDSQKESNEDNCLLKKNADWAGKKIETELFLVEKWRKELCRCANCIIMYQERGVLFLIDDDDTMDTYVEQAQVKRQELEKCSDEMVQKYFAKLPHVAKIEVVQSLNDFKTNLHAYLTKFAESKKVINVENIREFFTDLQNKRKKPAIQYFCR